MLSTDMILVAILTWSFSEGTTIYKEILINAATNISCFPNEDIQIQWHHTAPGRSTPSYLYAGGKFYDESNRGFRLEKDSNTGPYHLVIPNANYEDAGLYECKEDIGSRVFGSTQLTVLESNPVCESNMRPDGYVGLSTCNLDQENMTFTCAVSFNGEPPRMIWTTLNGSQPFNEATCKIENGRITCSLTIIADSKYDGSIFNCQLRNSSFNCSTEIIKIHYFERPLVDRRPPVLKRNTGDKVNCSVKSNQSLRFNWTLFLGDQHVFLVKDQELLIHSPGLYQCVVEYRIRNVPCNTLVTEVSVPNPNITTCPTSKGTAGSATTATIIVLTILVVICISALYRI